MRAGVPGSPGSSTANADGLAACRLDRSRKHRQRDDIGRAADRAAPGPVAGLVASTASWRSPGAIGVSGTSTHSPRESALTSPIGLSPSSTRTRSPGSGAAGDNGLAVAIDRDDVEARRLGSRGAGERQRRAASGRYRRGGPAAISRPADCRAARSGASYRPRIAVAASSSATTAPREPDDAPKRRSHV